MAVRAKQTLEVLLVKAELTGVPERGLPKSRNLVAVDIIWPRAGIARKSVARQVTFTKGKASFEDEPWAQRVLFREDVEDHTAFAVTITEPVTVQKIRRFFTLAAKYALKQGADFVESAMAGYGDIASAPADALAQMVGEKDVPQPIAQGVVDLPRGSLPASGTETTLVVPLYRTRLTKRPTGTLTLLVRG